MPLERMCIKLEILTPVHITDGATDELMPLEYVVDGNGFLRVIDPARFIKLLTPQERENFSAASEMANISSICQWIQAIWQSSPDRFNASTLWSTDAGELAGLYHLLLQNPESRFLLKPFIRSESRLYLPGSTLKGAIRTALISAFLGTQYISKHTKSDSQRLEAHVMEATTKNRNGEWRVDVAKDPLKALKMRDAFFIEVKSTVKKVMNIKLGRSDNAEDREISGIKNFAECIEPGAVVESEIALEHILFTFTAFVGRPFTFKHIIVACKAYYKKLIEHEKKKFFIDFDDQNPGHDISGLYDRLMEINRQPDSFLLRIGRFGGKNSTSFNIFNRQGKEPVSRNLVRQNGALVPLGWVKVSL